MIQLLVLFFAFTSVAALGALVVALIVGISLARSTHFRKTGVFIALVPGAAAVSAVTCRLVAHGSSRRCSSGRGAR